MTTHRDIRLTDLEPNPFRDLKSFKLEPARLDRLKASIGETGFWSNIQARPHPSARGKYQITAGHHRVAAASAVLGATHRHSVEVVECGDLEMLQRMAAENAEEFGAAPVHLLQCVEQAVALMRRMFADVPTLGQPSKAKTARGQRYAGNRAAKSGRTISASAKDMDTLRHLYGNEGSYQKARSAGQPGARVLVEFLRGAFDRHAVQTALRAYDAATQAGVPVSTIVNAADNVHQLHILSRSVTSDAAKHLSPDGVRETMKRTREELTKKKERGDRPPGRRTLATIGARAMREIAREGGNADAERAAILEELRTFMGHIPIDFRHATSQFSKFIELAQAAKLTRLEDRRMFSSFYKVLENLLASFAVFYESGLASVTAEHSNAMLAILARMERALKHGPSELVERTA